MQSTAASLEQSIDVRIPDTVLRSIMTYPGQQILILWCLIDSVYECVVGGNTHNLNAIF